MPHEIARVASFYKLELRIEIQRMAILFIDIKQHI